MTHPSQHPVALVSGGSRGIGRATVRRLVAEGYKVYFTYLNSEDEAKALVAELLEDGGSAIALQADARDHARAVAIAEQIRAEDGRLDLTVCNAFTVKPQEFRVATEEAWKFSIDGVLHSAFHYARASVDMMVEQEHGCIIFISSVNGMKGREGAAVYGAAKAGLINLARTMARELGPFKIRVNAIAPGYVDTESQASTPPLIKKLVRDETPLPGYTTPADIASAIHFLASDEARRITGHTLVIDGGQCA